ncbi:hypothetical protein F511_30920 [Dorcoceras hygrometricum]|uniref:Uncharacterized protein n=1 Tax=Dorcoceras hygrometricum TaxID=472368 RepID=A0A2Z7DAI9_9LAMI|nr:hypothetical protein F511_30920 [Dorcoceras hygrometricum]
MFISDESRSRFNFIKPVRQFESKRQDQRYFEYSCTVRRADSISVPSPDTVAAESLGTSKCHTDADSNSSTSIMIDFVNEETPDAQTSMPTAIVSSNDYADAFAQVKASVDQISLEQVQTRFHIEQCYLCSLELLGVHVNGRPGHFAADCNRPKRDDKKNDDRSKNIGYPRMSVSDESSTTMHRLLHASGSHPIPPPNDPKTNQYNQDLGLIHSTNGNHLESLNEGISIDHQVTIYLHAQNITMFPTNEIWYFASQILVSSSGGLILILTSQSTRN